MGALRTLWENIVSPTGRVQRPAVIATGSIAYATLLLGASLQGGTEAGVTAAGLALIWLGIGLFAIGAVFGLLYLLQRRSWGQDLADEVPLAAQSSYKPNYGPGKLSRPGDVDRCIEFAIENISSSLFTRENNF